MNDIPRPPGQHGLVMPMASERNVTGGYRTYLAERPDVDHPFAAPAVVTGLVGGDIFADAFLSDDGLTLFYAAASGSAKPDMFVAWRASTTDGFSLPTPLADLNTDADERDPWLSPTERCSISPPTAATACCRSTKHPRRARRLVDAAPPRFARS